MLLIIETMVLTRYRVDVADNRRARRLRTQVILARRIGVALIVMVALGSMMLTFPAIQALGAGLLASAGVISIVAGLAAQTSLVNVFAGIQLAFTDAIRVDDVVVVQKEWGRIEEITLTYVVVHIWDDRRLILPSTYFTTTPFENWTRRQSEVMGTVEFDLDWRAPVEAMRAELKKVLADTPLWDKRVGILQITDATAGFVRVRILVSAADSASLFDLRCLIREELVLFLQQDHPRRSRTPAGSRCRFRTRPTTTAGLPAMGKPPMTDGRQERHGRPPKDGKPERSEATAAPAGRRIPRPHKAAARCRQGSGDPWKNRPTGTDGYRAVHRFHRSRTAFAGLHRPGRRRFPGAGPDRPETQSRRWPGKRAETERR